MGNFPYFFMGLKKFFFDKLSSLHCDDLTKAYIVEILNSYKSTDLDMSTSSLTLLLGDARETFSFVKFQKLADWIFFKEALNVDKNKYAINIGKISYNNCHLIINKQWKIYEKMANEFEYLSVETNKLIFNHS